MKGTVIACLAGRSTGSAGRCGNSALLGCLQEPAAVRGGEALQGKEHAGVDRERVGRNMP